MTQQVATTSEATTPSAPVLLDRPMPHRVLLIGVTLSLVLHVAALAVLSAVRLNADRSPIVADLVVLTPPGPTPDHGPSAPSHAAPPAVAPAAPAVPLVTAARAVPPPEPSPPPMAPMQVPETPPPPAAITSKVEWPSVRVPSFQIPRLEAAATSSAEGPSPATIVAVQGALTSVASANPGPVSRAWGGKLAAATSTSAIGVFSAPRLEHDVKPRYPEVARRAGVEGTTVVKAYVRADGTVGAAEIGRSSGHSALDSAALDAIRTAQFVPAARGEFPVPVWIQIPVHFKLEE